MGFQVLLHVVGPCELLGAAGVSAWYGFLRRVDLGVPGSMAGCGKRLFAAVRVTIAAGVALGRAF